MLNIRKPLLTNDFVLYPQLVIVFHSVDVVDVPTKLTTGSSIPTIGLIGPTESNNFPPPVDSPKASSSSKTSEPAVSLLILGGSIFQLVKAMFMG
jgi:hypothetical protein